MPSVQKRHMRTLSLSFALALTALVGPATAGAATTIGQTFTPPAGGCGGATNLQTTSPGSSYAAPAAGVITSWSHEANATPPELVFKVARAEGGSSFTIVGESSQQAMTPDSLNSFPTRIPVDAGDVIGFFVAATGSCASDPTTVGFGYHYKFLDITAGVTDELFGGGVGQLDVSALLEPDADEDGYGDETQDQCPTDAGAQGSCPPPPPTTTPPTTTPPTTSRPTGQRAAALKKCKRLKKKTKKAKKARKKCRRKAKLLPV